MQVYEALWLGSLLTPQQNLPGPLHAGAMVG